MFKTLSMFFKRIF